MAVFAATGGGFDLLTFELDEIPIDTAETVESTAERISLVAGDETWEILGSDFTPVGEDVLPESGSVQGVGKLGPAQSFLVYDEEAVPLEELIAAIDEGDTTSFLTGVFAGSDVIVGTEEADVLFDVEGDDTLLGRAGRDELGGGPGADRLFGDQGPDTLTGGPGDDLLAGGSGQDVFVFDPSEPEEGDDTILDFNPDRDSIQLGADDIVEATTDGDLGADATPEEIAAAMDESDLWTLGPGATGTATVTHPGGSIALAGIPADALPVDSFTGLLDAGVLAIDDGGMIA